MIILGCVFIGLTIVGCTILLGNMLFSHLHWLQHIYTVLEYKFVDQTSGFNNHELVRQLNRGDKVQICTNNYIDTGIVKKFSAQYDTIEFINDAGQTIFFRYSQINFLKVLSSE